MRNDPVQTALDKLDGVKAAGPDQWQARCPAHEDRVASLSIGRGDDGRALVNCKAGCETAAVLGAVGLTVADLFTGPRASGPPTAKAPAAHAAQARPTAKKPATVYPTAEAAIAAAGRQAGGEFVAAWVYPDDGFRVARFNLPGVEKDGRPKKTFRPVHRLADGSGWALGDPPGQLPLYRGDEVPDTGPVVVVEGEKAADAARSIGLAAVTSAHGAKSAGKTYWRPLAGREIIILPDNDEAGRQYAETVALILSSLPRVSSNATVRIVNLPDLADLGEHADIFDWLEKRDAQDPDALRDMILDLAQAAPNWTPAKVAEPAPVLTCLATVEPTPVRWLWPSRIARGKFTLLAGDPGLGKSFITLDMAARVSKGVPFPDCRNTANPVGGVVLLSAEDDLADTIRPRLDAAGADVRRIHALTTVQSRIDAATGKPVFAPFNLTEHLPLLEQAIAQVADCRLVVIDPISAYLGGTDSHKNADIRGLLAPLSELAARFGVAVVGVTHLRKGEGPAMYRSMGSLAFVAAARAAYAVTKDADDPTGRRRFMLPVKNNLGNDRSGLAYRLGDDFTIGQPVVMWEPDPVTVSADEALAPDTGRGEEDPAKLEEAKTWLKDALAGGPVAAKEVVAKAKGDGIHKRTLDRAKSALNVEAGKAGFAGGWTWKLPGVDGCPDCPPPEERQGPQAETLATFDDVGDLRQNPQESSGLFTPDAGNLGEDCQAPVSGNLPLDPDKPGSTADLTPEQFDRYRAIFQTRSKDMPADEKHRRAWRAALRPR